MAVRAGDLRDGLEVWKSGPVTDENGDTDYVYHPLRTIGDHPQGDDPRGVAA